MIHILKRTAFHCHFTLSATSCSQTSYTNFFHFPPLQEQLSGLRYSFIINIYLLHLLFALFHRGSRQGFLHTAYTFHVFIQKLDYILLIIFCTRDSCSFPLFSFIFSVFVHRRLWLLAGSHYPTKRFLLVEKLQALGPLSSRRTVSQAQAKAHTQLLHPQGFRNGKLESSGDTDTRQPNNNHKGLRRNARAPTIPQS